MAGFENMEKFVRILVALLLGIGCSLFVVYYDGDWLINSLAAVATIGLSAGILVPLQPEQKDLPPQ